MHPLFILLLLLTGALTALLAHQFLSSKRRQLLERERNTMIALISHRLRTPLSGVKWYTEMLLSQEFGKLQISQMELLNKINGSVADAIEVLNTFLSASRVERGIDSKPVMLDLWENLNGMTDSHRHDMDEKHLILERKESPQRTLVYVDPLVLHTIFDVLLSNAITYTPDGGTIRIDADDGPTHVTLRVSDTGIGMSRRELGELFTKFYRAEKAKVVSTSGNGLGLYLVKRMLENIGGSIRCESVQGKGSVFTVMLPKGP